MNRTLLILLVVSIFSSCSKQVVSRFIDEVKENRSAYALTIPGWVISKGTSLAMKGVDENDERAILQLGKKIKKLRIVADENSPITSEEVKTVISNMQVQENYEPYTLMRHNGSDVYVMVQEENNRIRDLAILVHNDKSTVVLHMKTDLTMADLRKSNFSWNKKENQTTN
jgi:hypothetical protein